MKLTIDSDVLAYAFIFACVAHADSVLITNDRSFFRNVKKHHPEIKAYLLREMDVNEFQRKKH